MAFSAHIRMTLAYSPSQKSAKLIDEYSVWCPATSSLSASTRSKGVRNVSAIELMKNTTHIGNSSRLKPYALTKPRPKPCCWRSEEHTSELQSRRDLVCRLLLEKKKKE